MITISSQLTPEKLLIKLQKHSYPYFGYFSLFLNPSKSSYWAWKGNILGRFYGDQFDLNLIPNMAYQSGIFRSFFYGEVVRTKTGSEIIGDYSMSPTAKFMAGFLRIGGGTLLLFLVFKNLSGHFFDWQWLPILLVIYGLALLAPKFFWNAQKESMLYLTRFLEECAGDGKVTLGCAKLDEDRVLLTR